MKVVILAGGLGTRLGEETTIRPKPLVEIGGKPIIWHIMKHYSHYGINEFVILLGYKGYMIQHASAGGMSFHTWGSCPSLCSQACDSALPSRGRN